MSVLRKSGPGAKILKRAIEELDKKITKIGWFESSKYENGTPVAYVATIQEFGSPAQGIPPRPFFRPTITEKQQEWQANLKSGAKAILAGNESADSVMNKVGAGAVGDVKKTIATLQEPPLKESTIAARLRKRADGETIGLLNKPLIERGILLNTLVHVVENK